MNKFKELETLKSTSRLFTLESYYSWYKKGELNLSPIYQRDFVWSKAQQSSLILSFMREIPIGVISIVYDDEKGIREVVDGKQRLTSLFNFLEGKLTFSYKNNTFHIEDFYESRYLHLLNTSVPSIELQTQDYKEKLEFFIAINFNGTSIDKNHQKYVLSLLS